MTTLTGPVPITSFQGDYRFLSNFATLPAPVQLWGLSWATAEHAYQAGKAALPDDFHWVREAPGPGEAKRRGRRVAIRPDWEDSKRRVMLEAVLAKFSHPELRALLITTGEATLVEGNTWHDAYWGAVPDAQTAQGRLWAAGGGTYLAGHNWLGRILMMTRTLLAPEA